MDTKNFKRTNINKKSDDTKSLDNISITALRIISILNMLLEKPMSEDEINKELIENIEGSRNLSNDTICIYINTLRAIGCDISRPGKGNSYKYVLNSHPFKINISNDEINALSEIRKYAASLGKWKLSFEINELYNKITEFISTENKKNFLLAKKNSIFRETDLENIKIELLKSLEEFCEKKKDLSIIYDSPWSGEKEIVIKTYKITLENGSFYLWGYSYELNETMYLRLDRIISVSPAKTARLFPETKAQIEALYRLTEKSAACFIPCENDEVIENSEDSIVVKTKVLNKFKFIQEILMRGSECTVLSPESLRQEIFAHLTNMRKLYEHD